MRPGTLERIAAAVGIIVQDGICVLVAVGFALSGTAIVPFFVTLPLAALTGPAAFFALLMGFEGGRPGPATRSILWVQLAVQLIVIGAGLTLAGSYVADLRTTAPDTTDFVWFAGVTALAAAIAAILLKCLGWSAERSASRDRRIRTAVVGAVSFAVLFAALGAAAVGADRAGLGCKYYRFDREAWETNGAPGLLNEDRRDRSAIGEGLAECGRLRGLTDREVRHLLGGPPLTGSGSRSYSLGDPIWWSQRILVVRYGPAGRVTGAGVETRQID